jgi:hypothetical protein
MKQLFYLFIITQISIATLAQNKVVHLQNSPEEYKALGITKDTILPWENGARVAPKKGNNELWYCRLNLDDGNKIVIFFFMRDLKKLGKKVSPVINVEIEHPNGDITSKNLHFKASDFSASTTHCDVHIGENYFTYINNVYQIHISDNNFKMDVAFESTSEPWRPGTGIINFGNKGNQFGWIAPVPDGKATVSYTINGITNTSKGFCFHDHSWSNVSPEKLYKNWYWIYGKIGAYKVLIAEIIASKKYQSEEQLFFSIIKDGKNIVTNDSNVIALKSHPIKHPVGNKPISKVFTYKYTQNGDVYELSLKQLSFIKAENMIRNKTTNRLVKLFTGFDASWYRIQGQSVLNIYHDNQLKEQLVSNDMLWELIYLVN